MKLIMLGPPGAGKGTQAEVLVEKLKITHISTGDMLRNAIREGTPIGVKAKACMDAGNLVSDDIIIDLVNERLEADDCKAGFVFDGIPRTIAQAEALDREGIEIDTVLSLVVSDEVLVKRLSGRRTCPVCGMIFHIERKKPAVDGICDACGAELIIRKDDEPETILNRLKTYHHETAPLIDYYRSQGKLKEIHSDLEIAEQTEEVYKALGI